METENQAHVHRRLYVLFTIIFFALALLLLRLSYIQLVRGEEYSLKAEANRYAQQVVPAPRGQFKDRNGEVLVASKPSFTIQYVNPLSSKNDKEEEMLILSLAEKLVPLLDDPNDKEKPSKDEIISRMKGNNDHLSRSTPKKIKQSATDLQVARVKERLDELPGISVIPEAVRDYRMKTFGSHIFGYLNSIKEQTWPNYKDKGYLMTDRVGATGLEAQYEEYLRGEHGATRVEVNINGDPIHKGVNTTVIEKKPVPGNDLILTIDKKLQMATEAALAERVTALKGRGNVKNAAAVALDVQTGEVLALASYPAFDPNHWVNGQISGENYKLFALAEYNRVVQAEYAPGSTVKMLTTMIGLREGVIQPNETIYCPGYKDIAGYTAWCWDDKGHGTSTGKEAIAKSCNVFMYTVGMRLAKSEFMFSPDVNAWSQKYDKPAQEKFIKYHNEFGLGVKTGIDLPGENSGGYNYQPGTSTNMPFTAIGQNQSQTPLQLAQYVSTIANGGKRMRPFLVKEIQDPSGKVIKTFTPQILNTVSFSQELLQYAREGMWQVTHEPYGTISYMFKDKKYNIAGKTGTAQTGNEALENFWFVGYAPYENPRIAISIVVPDGPAGAHSYEMAGPIAETMLDTYFGVPAKEKQPEVQEAENEAAKSEAMVH